MTKKTIVISLGGSIVVPKEGEIDYKFLKEFKKIILKHIKRGVGFIIVVGGGKTCRLYQGAAKKVGPLVDEDLDWLGIHVTRLNAQLLRTIFRQYAHPKINTKPDKIEKVKEPILIGAGWKPGWSTDYDAVKLAVGYGAKEVINLSNIEFVYDKDPNKFKNAKKFEKMSWKDYIKMVGHKWSPGANYPFDPIASALAQKNKLRVLVASGKNLKNFDEYLSRGKIRGTVIE